MAALVWPGQSVVRLTRLGRFIPPSPIITVWLIFGDDDAIVYDVTRLLDFNMSLKKGTFGSPIWFNCKIPIAR